MAGWQDGWPGSQRHALCSTKSSSAYLGTVEPYSHTAPRQSHSLTRPPPVPLTRSPLAAPPAAAAHLVAWMASLAMTHVERETTPGNGRSITLIDNASSMSSFGPLQPLAMWSQQAPFESCASSRLCAGQGRWQVVPDPVLTSPSNKPYNAQPAHRR